MNEEPHPVFGALSLLLKLQTEIRHLVDKNVLHLKAKKLVINYHTPKLVIRFKGGRSLSWIEPEGDLIDDPV